MADMIDRDLILQLKEKSPGYSVVCYINTTADTKTVCDVCVTSSSAVKIISKMKEKDIIFVPDCNLGDYVSKQLPEKNIMLVRGGCPTHLRITPRDVQRMREQHPDALVLVHPECLPSVVALADYVGSTTGIMEYAKKSDRQEFIIGTENSIVQHLQFDCPEKKFYALSKDTVCHNMRITTLSDVYNFVKTGTGEEIILDDQTITDARRCIDEMLRLG
jgi:quinolinate synthase